MNERAKSFAEVVIPSPLKEPLTYAIPESLAPKLQAGVRVLVPLGKRRVTGVVVGFCARAPREKDVREILEALDERPILNAGLLKLCRWAARYYLAPLGEVFAAALPAGTRVEDRRVAVLADRGAAVPEGAARRIVAELERRGRAPLKTLLRKAGSGGYRVLDDLQRRGAIQIREAWRGRRPRPEKPEPEGEKTVSASQALELTDEQARALDAIEAALHGGGFETLLLFGITGSGKTEIYLRALELAQRRGKQSLVLVPEISLTPQLLARIRARFPGQLGVLHSALSPAERRAQWHRMTRGEVGIAVGARSAVFAPLPELGLIIVDEEHDSSYKQEEGFRYHARDLAIVRAQIAACPVVLGSATPSLESFHNALEGRYRLLELRRRVAERALPEVRALDLRPLARELWQPGGGADTPIFSPALKEAICENWRRGRQTLVFLNRRGFANFLQCRLCGFVIRCPHCSVTLTFHLRQRRVKCHHCGYQKPSEDLCPACGNPALAPSGVGTEQVEQQLVKLVPEARIARMDRDTTRPRGAHERLLRDWEQGAFDILVGTQMIAKGHDIAGVTLVAVVLADLSLHLPDFRAAERTFQLLTQVAGRAGRGVERGEVMIQTYAPDHYALRCVSAHDYRGFYEAEIDFRKALGYPPFGRLVLLRFEGAKPAEVARTANLLASRLRATLRERGKSAVEVLGPASAPIERLRGRYRFQILLKGKQPAELLESARRAQDLFSEARSVRLRIDVDPQNML
ncbi:MAG TPA: primosomal protein N' [Candidatus Acidoferrales bacterium]|nr:primosomal protein N' [Candidatus Acidoferrales bacterium]